MANFIPAYMSAVTYQCDLSSRNGMVIPIGFFVEVPKVCLGMIGRLSLTRMELDQVNHGMRDTLQDPWSMLTREFDEAFVQAPENSCQFLASKNCYSLNFSGPASIQLSAADLGIRGDHNVDNGAVCGLLVMHKLWSLKAELAPVLTAGIVPFRPAAPEPVRRPDFERRVQDKMAA